MWPYQFLNSIAGDSVVMYSKARIILFHHSKKTTMWCCCFYKVYQSLNLWNHYVFNIFLLFCTYKCFNLISYPTVYINLEYTVKPVWNCHSQNYWKLISKTKYGLMQIKSIAECSKVSILQYFWPVLSYHLSLRSLFCLFWVAAQDKFYCKQISVIMHKSENFLNHKRMVIYTAYWTC